MSSLLTKNHSGVTLLRMVPTPTPDYLARFSAALVSEIKAEMGRRDLSFRGLAMLLGENPQYVTSRLAGGNPRTGKRVEINVADLYAMASAMDLDPGELLDRAREAAGVPEVIQLPVSEPTRTPPRVAKRSAEKAGASEFEEGE
jgi:hypothetical protein